MSAAAFQISYAGNGLPNGKWKSYVAEAGHDGNIAVGTSPQPNFDERPYRAAAPRLSDEQPIRPALQRSVYSLGKLPVGWDGYEGIASARDAILDGVAFIHNMPADWPDPIISVGGSGAFSFYWREGDSVADIEFDGSGAIAAYLARHGEIVLSEIIAITGENIGSVLATPFRDLLIEDGEG